MTMAADVGLPRRTRKKRTAPMIDVPPNASIPVPAVRDTPGAVLSMFSKIIKSELHREIYCNNVRVGITQWDMSLLIGLLIEDDGGATAVRQDITVKFSPQFFKLLVATMTETLKHWEATFGQIASGPGQSSNTQNMSAVFEALRDVLKAGDKGPG